MSKYLIHFSSDHDWIDFKYAELNALLKLNGLNPELVYWTNEVVKDDKFLVVDIPNEEIVKTIMTRSVTIHEIYEYWSSGSRYLSDVLNNMKSNFISLLRPYGQKETSWSLSVDAVFGSLTDDDKHYYRKLFTSLITIDNLPGPIDIKNPAFCMSLLLDYTERFDRTQHDKIPAFFGRLIARNSMKEIINKYDLKKRCYLGPTSLHHTLALILCNIAQVKSGEFALDPFVGTASILVALSHFGCVCFGTDIDIRVLNGDMYAGCGAVDNTNNSNKKPKVLPHMNMKKQKQKPSTAVPMKRDIFENFSIYNLPRPDIIRLDNHLVERHYQLYPTTTTALVHSDGVNDNTMYVSEGGGMFDVIITDPPYGIRAGAKKSGKKNGVTYELLDSNRVSHIPSVQNYPVEEVMLDLLHTAALLLSVTGRLVYLIPTTYDFELTDLPVHPCFVINTTCEQCLSSRHGRRAVLMTKTQAYTSDLKQEFERYKQSILSTCTTSITAAVHNNINAATNNNTNHIIQDNNNNNNGFAYLIMKLTRALKADAFTNDEVVKRASNRCLNRKQVVYQKKLDRKIHNMTAAEKQNQNHVEKSHNNNNHDDNEEEEEEEKVVEIKGLQKLYDEVVNEMQNESLIDLVKSFMLKSTISEDDLSSLNIDAAMNTTNNNTNTTDKLLLSDKVYNTENTQHNNYHHHHHHQHNNNKEVEDEEEEDESVYSTTGGKSQSLSLSSFVTAKDLRHNTNSMTSFTTCATINQELKSKSYNDNNNNNNNNNNSKTKINNNEEEKEEENDSISSAYITTTDDTTIVNDECNNNDTNNTGTDVLMNVVTATASVVVTVLTVVVLVFYLRGSRNRR